MNDDALLKIFLNAHLPKPAVYTSSLLGHLFKNLSEGPGDPFPQTASDSGCFGLRW